MDQFTSDQIEALRNIIRIQEKSLEGVSTKQLITELIRRGVLPHDFQSSVPTK